MTREEEIQEFSYHETINRNKTREFQLGIIEGAIYADQHPRKGLWDAQKVIEWLNAVDFSKYVEGLRVVYVGRLKDDLIKAMEE